MSPRLKKKRCCEGDFCGQAFKPVGLPLRRLHQVTLYRDELEVLKLCDFKGLTQEQAGERMGVSRGTIQRLLTGGRKKVAQAIVTGAALIFSENT
ncbi:DUF134 domain-containing protein [Desulfobulbus sp. TB]|nr:DUF134 domain-containing protein [Desulfobulbus sp. TB]